MSKQFYFKQFSLAYVQFSSIWPIDRTLSSNTSPGQSGPGSDGKEGVLHISRSSNITGVLRSDYLVSYLGESLEESNPSVEKQSVYSPAPADEASRCYEKLTRSKLKMVIASIHSL